MELARVRAARERGESEGGEGGAARRRGGTPYGCRERGGAGSAQHVHGGMARQCHCCRHSDDVTFPENPLAVISLLCFISLIETAAFSI